VEDDVFWLVARLFKRGDLAFTVNGAAVTIMNKSADDIADLIMKKSNAEKLLMERRIHVLEKDKAVVRKLMKSMFNRSGQADDEDTLMADFQKCCTRTKNDLKTLEIRYESHVYPGEKVIEDGLQLLQEIIPIQSTQEFFRTIAKRQENLLDFAEDFEPIHAFFGGEQKNIFDKALRQMKIYDESKDFISNPDLDNVVTAIRNILQMQQPYKEIHKLPELLEQFGLLYVDILEKAQEPVLGDIEAARKRVFEVLDTKEYKYDKRAAYGKKFTDLTENVRHCNNIAQLLICSNRAETLKNNLLNVMAEHDVVLARAKADAEAKQRLAEQSKGQGDAGVSDPPTTYVVKQTRHVSLKSITRTSSWQLESPQDVDACVAQLKERLLKELDKNTIINIEL
jgi:hypothetical protein